MTHSSSHRIHRAWLLLVIATLASAWLRADGFVGHTAGALTIAIAALKARWIVLDFMEMRGAPPIWRAVTEGWVVAVSTIILIVYWLELGVSA